MRYFKLQVVTSTCFAQWNRRGREGEGADRKPVEPRKSRVSHGGCKVQQNAANGLKGFAADFGSDAADASVRWVVNLKAQARRPFAGCWVILLPPDKGVAKMIRSGL